MTSAIGDYALIGDGRSCALVAPTGSIDFLCWPKFDSDACFAALLGNEQHGYWRIAPSGYVRQTTRCYRGETTILDSEHETDTGRVRITDLMPWHDGISSIIRVVEGLEGEVEVAMRLCLRFGYGRVVPWMQAHERGLIAEAGPDRVMLDSPVALTIGDDDAGAVMTVAKGDRLAFVLNYSSSTGPLPDCPDVDALIEGTRAEWEGWIDRFAAPCRWAEPVRRSLITLRMLIDRDSGGMVAAATLGLPEVPGGDQNWDYRYCWLRDATFTLTALLNAGYTEEALRWRDWILRAVAGRPETMQIVYRIDGGRELPERMLDWLPGYRGARPVLAGNAAHCQTQLDVYGELMDGFDVLAKAGIERSARVIEIETVVARHLEQVWDQPSSDIWETRGPPQCYTYSQVMAWVGIDRFVKAHAGTGRVDVELIARLGKLRDTIHTNICERCYSSAQGHFVKYEGSDALDASLLMLPLLGFLPIDDARIRDTIAAIERDLMDGGLVRRFAAKAEGPDEGVFLACSCWLADCYQMQGRHDEAAGMLERVIGLANDVGLLSEEYHVPSRSLIGNVPQALTHIGIVNTAMYLSGPVIERAG